MTANEIADAIERLEPVGVQIISNMLRQQQAEIEALKPYKEKIVEMESLYDQHFKRALGQ
jgi:hypothetical protein